MMLSTSAMQYSDRSEIAAWGLAMLLNLAGLAIGDPYIVNGVVALLGAAAVAIWRRDRLALTAFVCTLTANPVNPSATIACNVEVATLGLLLGVGSVRQLPRWLFGAAVVASLSAVASVVSWKQSITPEAVMTQLAAVANYIAAPLVIVPGFFVGIEQDVQPRRLARGLVLWLLVPTLLLLAAARVVGTPASDAVRNVYQYELFTLYRLAAVDIVFTRTQVGIVLAALGACFFALTFSKLSGRWRLGGAAALTGTIALLAVTGSVGSALAMVAGWAGVIARYWRKAFAIAVVGGLAAGAGVLVQPERILSPELYAYVRGRYAERFESGDESVASDRVERWVASAGYLLENPTGVGWSLYVEDIGTYPHNDYLSYAIAWGALCGAAYLMVVLGLLLKLAFIGARAGTEHVRFLALAGLGAATVLAVNSMADHLTSNRWYFNVVWSVCWLCYFSARPTLGRQWSGGSTGVRQ